VTVTEAQIATLAQYELRYIEEIRNAADQSGCYLYLLVAMLEKETAKPDERWPRNVFGHDEGGVGRGFDDPVDRSNFRLFRHEVLVLGRTSNGIGPSQVTHPDLIREAESRGLKLWLPADNILYGGQRLRSLFREALQKGLTTRPAIIETGRRYNGQYAYGVALLEVALKWKERLGNADYV